MSDPSRFRIAVLCTGNRFRSPIAETLLHDLTHDLRVDVSSFGTLSLGAVPALPEALEAAAAMGLDLSAHRCRHFSDTELASADLVLGFERMHVATAVVDGGAELQRTFTLPELVELLREAEPPGPRDPVKRAREAIVLAQEVRSGRARHVELSEISDPFGGAPKVYRETAARVETLCGELASRLFGVPPRRRTGSGEDWLRLRVQR